MFRRTIFLCICTMLAVGLSGCGPSGPPMGMVKGTVTYKGKPIPLGTVVFVPQQESGFRPSTAEIREDGTFEATTPDLGKGVPVGQYRVMISASKSSPEAASVELLPAKYGSDQQSGLTAEVTEGENTIDFDLK